VDSKKVLLFTNQDNPIPDSLSKENKTIFNIINVITFIIIFLHNEKILTFLSMYCT